VPGVKEGMEGCPEQYNLLYLILAALFIPFLFVVFLVVRGCFRNLHHEKAAISRRESMKSMAFAELQVELFGEKALKRLQHIGSAVDLQRLASSFDLDSVAGSIRSTTLTNQVSEDDDAESV
jgi:hypothetical protein